MTSVLHPSGLDVHHCMYHSDVPPLHIGVWDEVFPRHFLTNAGIYNHTAGFSQKTNSDAAKQ